MFHHPVLEEKAGYGSEQVKGRKMAVKKCAAKKTACKKAAATKREKKSMTDMKKYVYLFGKGMTEGDASMKNLLGGKGANLAEMANLNMPVPAGFTITTECCVDYFKEGMKYPAALEKAVKEAVKMVEKNMGMKFGDASNPLLVSCRSGARSSMPGMMETVLMWGFLPRPFPALSSAPAMKDLFMMLTAVLL